jgi:hypothetical protein
MGGLFSGVIFLALLWVAGRALIRAMRAARGRDEERDPEPDEIDEDTLAFMIAVGLVDASPGSDDPPPGGRDDRAP